MSHIIEDEGHIYTCPALCSQNSWSRTTTMVFLRLEALTFYRKGPFSKNYEPRMDSSKQEGKSLQEDLLISGRTFQRAFDHFGTRYNSKSSFIKEIEPFKGKAYASYFDRKMGTVFFFRNDVIADSLRLQPDGEGKYTSYPWELHEL